MKQVPTPTEEKHVTNSIGDCVSWCKACERIGTIR